MSNREPDHHATLGVAAGASPEHLKRAYLALVKRWHPDRFANEPELQKVAEDKLRSINVAYEALVGEAQARVSFQHGSTAPDYDAAASASAGTREAYAHRERPSAFALWRGQSNWLSWGGTVVLVSIALASFWFAADTLADHYGPPHSADFIRYEAKLQSVMAQTRRAAEAGEVWAMANLGWFHFAGRGVPVNKAEAVIWFVRAGHAGDAGAQAQLGRMLAHGDGVSLNLAEASKWWHLAAAQGYRDAARERDAVLARLAEAQTVERRLPTPSPAPGR